MIRVPAAALLLALLSAACAGAAARPFSAARPLPLPEDVEPEADRARLADASSRIRLGDTARDSGLGDQARAEWKVAGVQLVGLGSGASPWRLAYLAAGARLLLQASEPEAALRAAERVVADPAADPATRAIGARVRAAALGQLAAAEVRAGKLEPLRAAGAGRPPGDRAESRVPAPTWLRLVEANDAYLAVHRDDPDPAAPEVAAAAAFQSALVFHAHDDPGEAGRRLRALLERFPATSSLGDAAGLWLESAAGRADPAAHAAALEQCRATVSAEQARLAAEPAAAPRGRVEELARLAASLERERQAVAFAAAQRTLAQGKAAEAAAAFEAFAAASPQHPDAPAALFNAGNGWAAARQAQRARAARAQLLERHPDSPLAPRAVLAEAGELAAAGEHAAASARYLQLVERFPVAEGRCQALRGAAAEADLAQQPGDAATRYLAFGTDPRCGKEDPNGAARGLYRAAALLGKAHRRTDRDLALKALAALGDLTDPVARGFADDARARIR